MKRSRGRFQLTTAVLAVLIYAIVWALLAGCATQPDYPRPPVLIPDASPLPADCVSRLVLNLPAGSTPEDVISAQHMAILAYEARATACGVVTEVRK